jgi:hypothetical protein
MGAIPRKKSAIERPPEGNTPMFVHAWIDELNLSAAEFRVLAHIFRRTGSKLNVPYFSSHAKAAKICNLSARTISECCLLFEQAQIVTIEKRKGRTSNIFLRACSDWATAEEIAKLRTIIRSSKKTIKS